jgi:hypothetical protein
MNYPAGMMPAGAPVGASGVPRMGVVPISAQAGAPMTIAQPAPPAVYSSDPATGAVPMMAPPTVMGTVPEGTGVPPGTVIEGSTVMPGAVSPAPVMGTLESAAGTIQPAPSGLGHWQGTCTGTDNCTACDACDGCGHPGCACGCGPFGGRFAHLFGSGCLGRLGHLHDRWASPARPVRVWGGIEALWWWNKERELPALATTSVPGTPFDQAGVLGAPGTSVLFGGEFDGDAFEGARATLGLWLDRGQNVGLFARAFQFGEEEIDFRAASAGDVILSRPFFDVGLGLEDAVVVAFPGSSRGIIDIQTSNEVRGYDLMLRKLLYYGECNRLDLIGGYYGSEIEDGVQVSHQIISQAPDGRVPVGSRINTLDVFEAENEFHGGSIGILATGYDGRLTWNLLSKIAFGNNRQSVTIDGTSSTFVPGGGTATFDQGLLALGTNNGVYERDQFAFVPELDLTLMYNLCSRLSVSVGYTVIYWSDVVLATDAVNTSINPTQIDGPLIGPARPIYSIVDDDFWLHGLTLGVHGRF